MIIFVTLKNFMKTTVKTALMIIMTAAAYAAAMAFFTIEDTAEYACRTTGECGTAGTSSEDFRTFHGFIAYNALNGTSAELKATEKEVLVYRNSFQNLGYNPASEKRPGGIGFKWAADNTINNSLSTKYFFFLHNDEILDGGLPTNAERMHRLRILII